VSKDDVHLRSATPILFLFDADYPGISSYYGGVFDPAFLEALKRADSIGAVSSQILRGDLLISSLAYKTAKVAAGPMPPGRAAHFSQSTEMRADMGLYKALVGDLADAFSEQWNTLDLVEFPQLSANHNLHCIFLPTIRHDIATDIDKILRSNEYYVGAVRLDLGNPLQRKLSIGSLIDGAFIKGGTLYMENDYGGAIAGMFSGAEDFCAGGAHGLNPEEFHAQKPSFEIPEEISSRGALSQFRMEQRQAPTIHERVADGLGRVLNSNTHKAPFEWDLKLLPNSPEEVEIQGRKLSDYLLNTDHPDGQSKAKFFDQELGIVRADSDFLRYQLVDGLRLASFDDLRVDDHGIRFEAILPILGRNSAVAIIKTAWIVRKGERASLITAVPARATDGQTVMMPKAEVLPLELMGDQRWDQLFKLATDAGDFAAAQTVPTPMQVVGYEIIMDGLCGWAQTVVPDGRRGFARWLLKSGKGSRHYRSGVVVYANTRTQSHEIALAYANAFARVLRRNGVECKVEDALD
jgi:hypothetical protein